MSSQQFISGVARSLCRRSRVDIVTNFLYIVTCVRCSDRSGWSPLLDYLYVAYRFKRRKCDVVA